MRIGAFEFRPRPVMTVLTVLLLAIFLGLSAWQLSRADYKEQLEAEWAERAEAAPLSLNRIAGTLEGMQYRPAYVRGKYDEGRQYLLDSRVRNGRVGFHVLTPMELARDEIILVNRGWVEKDGAATPAADIAPPPGEQTARGILAPAPGVGLRLGPPSPPDAGWPRAIQYVEMERIEDELGQPVAPYTLVLDEGEPGAFKPDWYLMSMGPATHYGYAFQWFALAVALMVLFVVLNTRRVAQRPSEEER